MNRNIYRIIFALMLIPAINAFASFPGLKIVSSNEEELVISYKPVFISKSIDANLPDNFEYSELETIPQSDKKNSFIKIPITVPNKTGFDDQNVDITYDNASDAINNLSSFVNVAYSGIARNRHISHIKIYNSIFDVNLNKYITPSEIKLTVKFDKIKNYVSKSVIDDDNNFNFTINHNQTRDWLIPQNKISQDIIKHLDMPMGLNTANWAKITIESEGVYKIDASQLSSLGFNIAKNDIATIKVFGNGGKELNENQTAGQNNKLNEQEIIIKTNASGDLESIIFYAAGVDGFNYKNGSFSHYINHYSKKNYYFITWGGDNGKRANAVNLFEDSPKNTPDVYTHRFFFEEELSNAFISGSGRQWFGRTIFPANFTNVLQNLYRSGSVKYKVTTAHRASHEGDFQIYESNYLLGNISLTYINSGSYVDAYRKTMEFELPAERISSDNRSVLKFTYTNSDITTALPMFDFYEISYPRSFVAINNELNFWSDEKLNGKTEFSINSFSGDIYGFNISDKINPKLLKNNSNTGGLFIFRDTLSSDKPKNYYLSGNLKKPTVEKTEYIGIRENLSNAELIIISPPEFLASAEAFRDYRISHDKMTAVVIKTDNIFNEFGSGIADPTSIRDFISFAYHNWQNKPKYVALWGSGHYDYKNISSQKKNFIPPYESEDDKTAMDAITSTCVEDYFIRVDGDDNMPDLSIGRLTIQSPETGNLVLNKIKNYESNSSKDLWRDNVLLVADDSFKGNNSWDGSTHTGQSEVLSADFVPLDILQKKIYLVEYPKENIPNGIKKPAVTEELLNTINNYGTMVLNWVGHGNPRVWAHETVLERETTIPLFKNSDKLFFLCAATCDFGRFDMPEVRCGSEEMFIKNGGGAIAVFSSTRVVLSSENAAINKVLFTKLFERNESTGQYSRLGDIMYGVKSIRYSDNDEKFYLIGDPTLKLHLPELVSSIDKINGIDLTNLKDTVKIQALTEITITGSIRNYLDNKIDDTFNGAAILNVFDADKLIKAIDIDYSEHYINKFGGALNKSSCIVKNGKFEVSFIIPKDISFSKNTGRIFVYAFNNTDNRTAKGNFNKIRFIGNDTITDVDATPPTIKIYLETRNFKNGDVVSQSPLLIVDLEDAHGINASGTGIGHLIEAWIDDNPSSINLTPKFNSATDGTQNGSIEQMLSNMSAGKHNIKIRAWNVYNKYSVASAEFNIISEQSSIYISDFVVYPNPFTEGITIKFNHNLTQAFSYKLNIFNTTGQLVQSINNSKVSGQFEYSILWDGRDLNGNPVPSGNYIFSLEIDSYYKLNTTKYFGVMEKIK
jgi:hypothetical protein